MGSKKQSKEIKRVTQNRMALLVLILVALFIFFGYWLWDQQGLTRYLGKVEEIEKESNSKLYRLNRDFAQFRGDVRSASYALPKFKEGEKTLRKARTELNELNPPEEAKDLHQSLLKFYGESASLCGDLASLAKYVVDRNKILTKFVKDVQTFDRAAKKAKNNEEAMAAAKSLKKSADKAWDSLENLPKPKVLPYSNEVLASYLVALVQASDLLQGSIERKDPSIFKLAVAKLNEVFSQVWARAQFVEDEKGMEKYRQRIREIESLRQQVTAEQQNLQQKTSGK